MVDAPLWFLIGLFFVKILHSILKSASKNNVLYYLSGNVIIIGIVFYLKRANIDLLFSIDSALMAFPFFSIGNIMKDKNVLKLIEPGNKKRWPFIIIGVITGYSTLAVIAPFNGRVDVNYCIYGRNIILFYFMGIAGIMSTILLSLLYTRHQKIITIIANGTIIILAFHGMVSAVILRIAGLRGEDITINPLTASIIAIINLLIFILPIITIKKYFPILMGKHR
jgi:hypothetical protein